MIMIVIIMAEEYNPEIIQKYEKLRKNYDCTTPMKHLEEKMDDYDIKETMTNFNDLIKNKKNELKHCNDNIGKLTKYRDEIIEVLKDMKSMEVKYMKLCEKKDYNDIVIDLEPPSTAGFLSNLSCDVRGDVKSDDPFLPYHIQKQLFTINRLYTDSLCKAYCYIDEKLADETLKMSKINDYINVYKDSIKTVDIDKELCNKYNCTICYENEVNVCFVPCGHTFCRECGKRANQKCFICKGVVTETKRIFLIGDADEVPSATTTGPVPADQSVSRGRWNIFAR